MKKPFTFLSLWFFLILLLVSFNSHAYANGVILKFEVEPSFTVDVADTIVFSPVTPGQSVEQTLPVLVKSNTKWDLTITGQQTMLNTEGEALELVSQLEVRDSMGHWQQVNNISNSVKTNQPSTDNDGVNVGVDLRFICDYADPPGEYETNIEVTLMPLL